MTAEIKTIKQIINNTLLLNRFMIYRRTNTVRGNETQTKIHNKKSTADIIKKYVYKQINIPQIIHIILTPFINTPRIF